MNIAILGGGISALTAAFMIKNKFDDEVNIDIISKDFGGDFIKGGFKYMYHTPAVEEIYKQLAIPYELKLMNGALYYNGEIFQYPFCFFNGQVNYNEVQHKYWIKTRNDIGSFDKRCMNDPWSLRNEIKIMPTNKDSYVGFLGKLISELKGKMNPIVTNINSQNLIPMLDDGNYEFIIYTIPIKIYLDSVNIRYDENSFTNKTLKIIKADVEINKIWWDYLYVIGNDYPFHRISKDVTNGFVDVEINSNNIIDKLNLYEIIENFMDSIDIDVECIDNSMIDLKGQITIDNKSFTDVDKIILLGRFAEWNKRITYDKVVDKIKDNIIPKLQTKIKGTK